VELGKFTFSSNSFVDGKRASFLFIFQSPGGNALETANNVYATLEQLKKSFPPDVDYAVPFESITIIKVSMLDVLETLLKALGLVADTDPRHSGLHPRHILLLHPAGVHD